MRTLALPVLALLLVLGIVVGAVQARAEGEGGDMTAKVKLLEDQVKALKGDTELLYSREAALTKYVLTMSTAANDLRQGIANARAQGFEAASISANSRIAVLQSLDKLAKDLSTLLPAPTKEEQEMARRNDQLRKELFPR